MQFLFQRIVTIFLFIRCLQFCFVSRRSFVMEIICEGFGEGINIFFETFSVFLTKAIGHKINVDVKGGKRSAQHLSVFAIDSSAAGIYFFNSLMKAVAHASPITALHLLNIESSAEDQQTQHHYADKTEVHSPKYVTFYFHYSSEFFSCYL